MTMYYSELLHVGFHHSRKEQLLISVRKHLVPESYALMLVYFKWVRLQAPTICVQFSRVFKSGVENDSFQRFVFRPSATVEKLLATWIR